MQVKDTLKALKICRLLGVTANLISPHGEGKSSVVRQYCDAEGLNYHEFRTGQAADAGDLTGLPEFMEVTDLDENNKEFTYKVTNFVLPAWFPRKPNSVVFFDEVNRGAKDILNGVFEAILDISMKGIKMPKGCQIISAMNPPTEDYSGTIDFDDKAFQDRFVHIKFQPSFQDHRDYFKSKHEGSGFLEFLGEDDKMLRSQALSSFTLEFVIPSPRSWDTAMKLEKLYDAGQLDRSLFRELMYGIVGGAATDAAITYKETHVSSIKGKDVIEGYHVGDIRNRVKNAIKKGRTDIIGNMIQEVGEELKARKGLNNQEGLNLIEIVRDVTPEQAYTLGTIYKDNYDVVSNVEGMPDTGEGAGLMGNDDLVNLFLKTQKAREKANEEIEKSKKKRTKKAAEEV